MITKNITVENYPGHFPLIDASDNLSPAFSVGNIGTCKISGLIIKGSYALGESSHFGQANIVNWNDALLTVENCELYDFNHCGIKMFGGRLIARDNVVRNGGWTFQDHGIYLATGDTGGHEITGCEIYGCSGWGIHAYSYEYDAIISANNIHDNFGGIVITGERHQVLNNQIGNNIGGNGIYFFHYGLIDLIVTGNQCAGNTPYDLRLDASEGEGFTNCTIENNTGVTNLP